MDKNRRKFSRIPMGHVDAEVVIHDVRTAAQVVDESINGVRLTGLNLWILPADQEATIGFRGDEFAGLARTIRREKGNTFSVGFQRHSRSQKSKPTTHGMLLNCYWKSDGQSTVCIPLRFEGKQVRIQRFDGAEMLVSANELCNQTRIERFSELKELKSLEPLLNMYGIRAATRTPSNLEALFAFEFGELVGSPEPEAQLS